MFLIFFYPHSPIISNNSLAFEISNRLCSNRKQNVNNLGSLFPLTNLFILFIVCRLTHHANAEYIRLFTTMLNHFSIFHLRSYLSFDHLSFGHAVNGKNSSEMKVSRQTSPIVTKYGIIKNFFS